MTKPILFLVFNRLDYTRESFAQIQKAKPSRLYIAQDGARQNKKNGSQEIAAVRHFILQNINWDCEVQTLFRDENLGCGKAVSSAITWFFENEEDGIILEDDCVANESFFEYCEALLEKYKNDKRIWHIAGDAPYENLEKKETYYFAKIQHCWGWASWRDRWAHFELDLKNYDEKNLVNFSPRKEVQEYWRNILHKMQKGEIDSWAYPWSFCIVAHKGFCINPYKNLVSNIGNIGLHYQVESDSALNKKTYELKEVVHPNKIMLNEFAVDYIYTNNYKIAKPTMLYIRHSYHSKTKSNDFLVEILKNNYEITICDIDPYTQGYESAVQDIEIKKTDVLLLFQMPINANILKKHLKFKKGIFVPMFDGAPARIDKIWISYKDFSIINFSETLHNELAKMGFISYYTQFFPKPLDFNEIWGNEKSAFFWQRLTKLNINTFKDILKHLSVKKIHIHKALDPNQSFVESEIEGCEISYSTWYENRQDMLNDIQNSAIYLAPREFEGIGMSFLEAMAMGRCVVATNSPTMNEYIKDGETGILFDFNNPILPKKYDIRKIQQNTVKYICNGYEVWEREKFKILEWIENSPNISLKPQKISFWHELIKKFHKANKNSLLEQIFSVKNHPNQKHKVITFLGIRIKLRRKGR